MNFLPHGGRQWLGLVLRLGLAALALLFADRFMMSMPGKSYLGPFRPLNDDEVTIRDAVRRHVSMLAVRIGERNSDHYAALNESAAYIQSSFEAIGIKPATVEYETSGHTVKNIEVEIPGNGFSGEVVLAGAHYDSARGSPGANDNATGVAAILELAKLLKTEVPRRTIRLVAFVNEEPPYFQTDAMGSRVYARRARDLHENVVGMISIETIGCYSDEPGSQLYPRGFSLFYPDKGNFIGFVGNLSSRALVRQAIAAFRETTLFPSEAIAAPGWLTGVGWSDHWSFWQEGYPAIMVIDTALFRYRQYHTSADTADRIDYDRTARVVCGLGKVLTRLTNSDP
jgi:Zn-dependent M28 family amino/carboxypeptidase